MNQETFLEMLHRFDRKIGVKAGISVILLVDNCSAHREVDKIPELQNLNVHFLPPNTTRKIQALDADIIETAIVFYKNRFMKHALEILKRQTSPFKT